MPSDLKFQFVSYQIADLRWCEGINFETNVTFFIDCFRFFPLKSEKAQKSINLKEEKVRLMERPQLLNLHYILLCLRSINVVTWESRTPKKHTLTIYMNVLSAFKGLTYIISD